ncbi:HAD-IA family hydrolase [Mycolicibacterium stellerae]|uniref:HAD-IA family hydrolase n=1 Tax=Mycolicibacterium stellerae TaxID=2358193 RepID=UPI001F3FBC34|nr:HAD-IA family hydrolase [Mycolicibacterium stellerae]
MTIETVSFAVDGLLLDCDGVLVDSHDAAAVAWNQWAKRWAPGFDFHRDIEHGRRISDLVAELISNPSDVATAVAELTQHEIDYATNVDEMPGARQLLDSCPDGSWAVVTSGNRALATARMASAGLPSAAVLVTSEDVANGKPFPDPYVTAAQRLHLAPTRCAAFEDAPAGVESARNAGVVTIIGVGAEVAAAPVTLAVADMRGVRFDGSRLDIERSSILPQTEV